MNNPLKNLLGEKNWDADIRRELSAAGIEIVEDPQRWTEARSTLIGKLGNWTFKRAAHCWQARADRGKGMPEFEAEGLNLGYREEVRVAGVRFGAKVRDRLSQWQTIDFYEVGTQGGLNALATQILSLDL